VRFEGNAPQRWFHIVLAFPKSGKHNHLPELVGRLDHLDSDEEAEQAANAARKLLVHVSNCNGLAILSERFSSQELGELIEKFSTARDAGVSLLDWAEKIRKK